MLLTPTDYHEITVDEPMNEMALMINQDILPGEVVSNTLSGDEVIYCVFGGEKKRNRESLKNAYGGICRKFGIFIGMSEKSCGSFSCKNT